MIFFSFAYSLLPLPPSRGPGCDTTGEKDSFLRCAYDGARLSVGRCVASQGSAGKGKGNNRTATHLTIPTGFRPMPIGGIQRWRIGIQELVDSHHSYVRGWREEWEIE